MPYAVLEKNALSAKYGLYFASQSHLYIADSVL